MSLLDALRSGIKIADGVTKPFQCLVKYERYVSEPGGYDPKYAPPVSLRAVVDTSGGQARTASGIVTAVTTTLDLLDAAAVSAATGGAGIGPNDRFTLQDGRTGPIVSVGGFADAGTGKPVATTVRLG